MTMPTHFQSIGLGITLAIAIVAGAITGKFNLHVGRLGEFVISFKTKFGCVSGCCVPTGQIVQGPAKKRGLGCVNSLPGFAWL